MRWRLLTAALVAAMLVPLATGCGDDGDDPVAAGDDPSSTTSSTAIDDTADDEPSDGHTGFYVPGELPDGWNVEFSGGMSTFPMTCPCRTEMWRRASDGAGVSATVTSDQELLTIPDYPESILETTGDRFEAIDGGYIRFSETENGAHWFDGEVTRMVSTVGLPDRAVADMAALWEGDEPFLAPGGFDHIWTGSMDAIAEHASLYWRIDDGQGRSMMVYVQPWMYDETFDPASLYPDATPQVLDGNGFSLVQPADWTSTNLEGLWPGGAKVTVAENYGEFNYVGPYLTAEEMLEVAGGFHELSAAEWEQYLEENFHPNGPDANDPDTPTVEAQRKALTGATLTDLLIRS